MALPDRNLRSEDAYVAGWSQVDDTEGLMEAITEAMDARRPRLAARLVGLLDDRIEIPPDSPIERARNAARMLLHNTDEARANDLFNVLEDAWAAARRRRMNRIKRRMRLSSTGRHETVPRVGRRNRKRQ